MLWHNIGGISFVTCGSWIKIVVQNSLINWFSTVLNTVNLVISQQVWEFDQAHQRWLPVAELALPGNKGDQVYSVAWAPNIGRYEML